MAPAASFRGAEMSKISFLKSAQNTRREREEGSGIAIVAHSSSLLPRMAEGQGEAVVTTRRSGKREGGKRHSQQQFAGAVGGGTGRGGGFHQVWFNSTQNRSREQERRKARHSQQQFAGAVRGGARRGGGFHQQVLHVALIPRELRRCGPEQRALAALPGGGRKGGGRGWSLEVRGRPADEEPTVAGQQLFAVSRNRSDGTPWHCRADLTYSRTSRYPRYSLSSRSSRNPFQARFAVQPSPDAVSTSAAFMRQSAQSAASPPSASAFRLSFARGVRTRPKLRVVKVGHKVGLPVFPHHRSSPFLCSPFLVSPSAHQEVEGLGFAGDQVNVPAGFARNKLIPQKAALPAIPKFLRQVRLAMEAQGEAGGQAQGERGEAARGEARGEDLAEAREKARGGGGEEGRGGEEGIEVVTMEERVKEAEEIARRLDSQRLVPFSPCILSSPFLFPLTPSSLSLPLPSHPLFPLALFPLTLFPPTLSHLALSPLTPFHLIPFPLTRFPNQPSQSIRAVTPKRSSELREPITQRHIISEIRRQFGIHLSEANVPLSAPLSSIGDFEVPLRFPRSVLLPGEREQVQLDVRVRRC
ncbi:unnamed protein product [Closterium sp. NIES-53]